MRNVVTRSLSDRQYSNLGGLLKSDATYNILNSGRQSGKTYTIARLAFILSVAKETSGCKILIVAPYASQADTVFFNVQQVPGAEHFITRTVQSPYKTMEFNTGSVIDFRSADNPKSIRSKSYNYIFLDEFAFFKDGAFDLAIVPTLIASGDKCRLFFSSTPNGMTGEFYDFATKGMDPDNKDYSYYYMNYNDNPNRNMKIIESERLRQPANRFRQEFLGEFVADGGDVFTELEAVMQIKTYRIYELGQYYAGIDWGKVDDSTVLTILNKEREVVVSKSFKGDWTKQVSDISLILNIYKPIVYAECNSIGDPLISQLKKSYTNVREFVMTNASKKNIVESLRMVIMLQDISLPSRSLNTALFNELTDYTYSMTKTGLITYHHKPSGHDDYVDSLAIANHCYDKHNIAFQGLKYKRTSDMHA